MKYGLYATVAAFAVMATAYAAPAQAADAVAQLQDQDGNSVGQVELHEKPHGTLLHAQFENMPSGAHAFHIHEKGVCEGDFTSAGGHYNPDEANHGIDDPDGMHAGDMPNIHVPDSGALEIEVLNHQVSVEQLLGEEDGTAIVIHEGPDDYMSDPAGAAGPRIACGVIEAP